MKILKERSIQLGLVAFAAWVGFCLFYINRSLWMDEFNTYFIIKDGLPEVWDRAINRSYQSPFYFIVLWMFTQLAGLSEVALRLPSFIFILLAAGTLYAIGKHLFDQKTALLSCLLYLGLEMTIFTSINARPYALAHLVMALSFLFLLFWVSTGKIKYQIGFIVTGSLIPHLQYILIPVFGAHFIYVVLSRKKHTHLTWGKIALSFFIIGLAMAPLLIPISNLWGFRVEWSWKTTPQPHDLFNSVISRSIQIPMAVFFVVESIKQSLKIPKSVSSKQLTLFSVCWIFTIYAYPLSFVLFLLTALALSIFLLHQKKKGLPLFFKNTLGVVLAIGPLLLAFFLSKVSLNDLVHSFFPAFRTVACIVFIIYLNLMGDLKHRPTSEMILLWSWVLIPPLCLFFLAIATEAKVFLTRYFTPSMLALSLLLSRFLQKHGSFHRNAFFVFLLMTSGAHISSKIDFRSSQNWRARAEVIKSIIQQNQAAFLFESTLVEAKYPVYYKNDYFEEAFLAPFRYYGIEDNLHVVPYDPCFNENQMHTADVIDQLNSRPFVYFGRNPDCLMETARRYHYKLKDRDQSYEPFEILQFESKSS